MTARFHKTFIAAPEHIDVMGHVNNAVWVQWIQDMATAHWDAVARAEDQARFVWLVVRHEIDYRGNIAVGESTVAETFIPGQPKGAKFDRRVDFRNPAGKVIVSAKTTWAMLDAVTLRPQRVRPEIAAPFFER